MKSADGIDIVICTNSIASSSLARVVDSIVRQQPISLTVRLILVLNGKASSTPIHFTTPFEIEVIRIRGAGLSKARLAAFQHSKAEYLVLLDDDTVIAQDYLCHVQRYFEFHPDLGAGGGINIAEVEGGIPEWLGPCLPNMAIRDHGQNVIVSERRKFGPAIPVGAGMILRRAVAQRFRELFHSELDQNIFGRRPGSLQGGEDTILAFCAFDVGLQCFYLPSLRLIHIINRRRVRRRYVAQLNFALGKSHARVCKAIGYNLNRSTWPRLGWILARHYLMLRRSYPQSAFLLWFWYLGFASEAKAFWKFED